MKLPGKIKSLAETDSFEAQMLASRGRKFSEIEEALWGYYWIAESIAEPGLLERMHATFLAYGGSPMSLVELKRGHQSQLESEERDLCAIFMNAVKSKNPELLFQIAEAVAFFKRHGCRVAKEKDPVRASLLMCKRLCIDRRLKLTSNRLAELCGWEGDMSQFRAVLDELRVPWRKQAGGQPPHPRRNRRTQKRQLS